MAWRIGNTVRLRAQFKDFDGVNTNADGDAPVVAFYDAAGQLLHSHTKSVADRTTTGLYTHYYVPTGEAVASYRWSGTIGGRPVNSGMIAATVQE